MEKDEKNRFLSLYKGARDCYLLEDGLIMVLVYSDAHQNSYRMINFNKAEKEIICSDYEKFSDGIYMLTTQGFPVSKNFLRLSDMRLSCTFKEYEHISDKVLIITLINSYKKIFWLSDMHESERFETISKVCKDVYLLSGLDAGHCIIKLSEKKVLTQKINCGGFKGVDKNVFVFFDETTNNYHYLFNAEKMIISKKWLVFTDFQKIADEVYLITGHHNKIFINISDMSDSGYLTFNSLEHLHENIYILSRDSGRLFIDLKNFTTSETFYAEEIKVEHGQIICINKLGSCAFLKEGLHLSPWQFRD